MGALRELLNHPGLSFFIAALVLLVAAAIGWVTARRAERAESLTV